WRGPAAPATAGAGWQAISGDLTHPMPDQGDSLTAVAVAPSDPNTVYVGAFDGSLSVSHDAANTQNQPSWAQVALGGLGTAAPLCAIAVQPNDADTVYWGYSYVGAGNLIFKSTDGGATKVNIAGNLPSTPINAIVVDPAQPLDIYVATDVGVFVAGDGGVPGEQWMRLGSNLPAAAVLSLAWTQAGGTATLVAGTHGRGAWSIPAMAPSGFTITATPATATVEAGQTATYTLTTTASNGASTIALSCAGDTDCTVTPASIPAGGSATVTATPPNGGGIANPMTLTVTADNGS